MSDIIQLLPDHVANQIAAGEVVQRPASVVKELLENAIDAGATNIKLLLKDAGKTLIQVIDDGKGMSTTDARMSFERHATSKIQKAEDLFNLSTKGFRGEALASIAAIAHVELKTKPVNEELGTSIKIEGSKIISQDFISTGEGTSLAVKNLFYNIPARRNFLKSDTVETRHIIDEFQRVALAHADISFLLHHNNNEVYHLKAGNLRQRIVAVFGTKMNEKLVPIDEKTDIVTIQGFVAKPEFSKRKRGEQFFFVNDRFIKSSYLNHAVVNAFDGLLEQGAHPSYFLYLTVPANTIDINIHPTKTEIKFEDEQAIYAIMRACVKRSLGQYNIAPSLDFSQEISLNISQSMSTSTIKEPQIKVDSSYNPFGKADDFRINEQPISQEIQVKTQLEVENNTSDVMQIGNKYIAFTTAEGMVLLHQRRAHKRILFEYFSTVLSKNKGQSQQLLFPKEIHLNKKDITIIKQLKVDLLSVGFSFEIQENDSIAILGIPAECQEENLQFVIESLIEQHKNNEQLQTAQHNDLANSLANSLAINEQKKLSTQEMLTLKTELLKCSTPSVCPLGKATLINLQTADLEKYF